MSPLFGRLRSALAEASRERASRRAAARLRRALDTLPADMSADAVVDFLFSEDARAIEPWQFEDEFRALARVVESRRPHTLLEIGTADGGTLFAHTRLAAPDALVISIDLPHGEFGGGYPPWRRALYERFAHPAQRLVLLQLDSHAPSTALRLEQVLNGRRLDYAFIDGDHTLAGVRQDFELCLRFAAYDATIAFHDIVEHPAGSGCEVHDLWMQLRSAYRHEEFVHDRARMCYGIGVLYLDGAAAEDSR